MTTESHNVCAIDDPAFKAQISALKAITQCLNRNHLDTQVSVKATIALTSNSSQNVGDPE